jgi:hypothetical protein
MRLAPPEFCLAAGLIAVVLLLIDTVWQPAAAAQAWLAAWLFWIGLAVGALFLGLAHGLIGGRWGVALRPVLLDMIGALPLLALFLVPVLVGAHAIYPWAHGGEQGWLNFPFFAARAVIYVAIWNAIALLVRRESRVDGALPPALAWPCLIILFLTASLAALDWMMTLEPHWTSTIYGMEVTAGWALAGLAAAILLSLWRGATGDGAVLDALARLMLALVLLWTYLSTVQLIVIWESDLVGEIPWYLRRSAGGWLTVGILFIVLQFAVPFLLLLWRPVRRSPTAMAIVAAAILTAHLLETWWLTMPDFGRPFGWQAPIAVIAIGGCTLFVLGRDIRPLARSSHERS